MNTVPNITSSRFNVYSIAGQTAFPTYGEHGGLSMQLCSILYVGKPDFDEKTCSQFDETIKGDRGSWISFKFHGLDSPSEIASKLSAAEEKLAQIL